jgi:serine/threonine protein kinase/tetratricopeptide (TPR) repeat protein
MSAWKNGFHLGPYVLDSPLGEGGMGEVWKARDTRLGRIVAIKRLKGEHGERFEHEARAVAALNHPNICQIHDIGPDYLVLEYIDGKPLQGPLPVADAARLAIQIASALEEAHGRGILHRDLKPANILVTPNGTAKLLDFGLAKSVAVEGATRTIEGTISGTPAYMAPEQIEGQPCDARSDVFSFGAVLYEMLAGRRAFDGMAAVLRDDPKPPPALESVVLRCLAKQPGQRYQTMAEVKAALESASATPVEKTASIAVLPFANMSRDADDEYFSDGLAEEIINALTQITGLKVIARTSAFAFKGKNEDIRKIAETLGVSNVLEGSVRRSGTRLRVTAQLIHAADGTHLWSQRFDRELTDVFTIQDEISAAIADQLKVHLTGGKRQTTNIEAYEAFLEGRHHWYNLSPADVTKGLKCYEKAIALDPGYAPAHAGVSEYYLSLAILGMAAPAEVIPKMEAAARRALELDPTLADAHSMLANVSAFLYRWDDAKKHYLRALELSSASVHIRHPYIAWYLESHGFLEEALREADRGLGQDPLSPLLRRTKGRTLLLLRRYDEAAEWYQRALDVNPREMFAALGLARSLAQQNQFEQAITIAEQTIQATGRWAWTLYALGSVHAVAGHTEEAHHVLDELRQLAQTRYVPASLVAMLHAQLGEKDSAFECASKAVEQSDPLSILLWKNDPAFDSLRSDPRYLALLQRMNLA